MRRHEVETIITEYLKPIFGFALKRAKNLQDAEDLSQEIVFKAFRAMLVKDDIADMGKFIWTVAHNTLANYYRDRARSVVGVPLDEVAELIADPDSTLDRDDTAGSLGRLQSEIAYLSKLQRRIVIAYFFENKKQSEIADELGIPLGTVKWHLFEAKKELKRGMDTMRNSSELKFNPIKFENYGISGSIGTKTLDSFFRSAVAQNICYCVRNEAMTVNEIADCLGISPVYVENEAEYLEEYGYLRKIGDKYIVNFIIHEPTVELLTLQNAMYRKAGALFANALYDELTGSGILDDEGIICGQTDEPISLTESPCADKNFLLWALIPYIAAQSGESLMEEKITFDEVATMRPDGAHNMCNATVINGDLKLPDDYVYMKNWCGPSWNCNDTHTVWQIDSEWSGHRVNVDKSHFTETMRVLHLYAKEDEDGLDKEEYTWLAERGFVKTNGDFDGYFKSSWQVVILDNAEIKNRLLSIGTEIKEKYKSELDEIKAPYVEAMLAAYPEHMKKQKAYELQYVFHSDGWFLLHCINALLENGKLTPPTENQKRSVSTLIFPKK